jgi:hypothetical protein
VVESRLQVKNEDGGNNKAYNAKSERELVNGNMNAQVIGAADQVEIKNDAE